MDTFIQGAKKLIGRSLSQEQVNSFMKYMDLLIEWNQKINLTAIRTPEEILSKHFLDSLSLSSVIQTGQNQRLIDIGTGAGLPGIPLKILYPDLKLTLVEGTGKKAKFCQLVVDSLELKDVSVITARAEELGRQPDYREMYDIVAARAVANLPVLLEYLLPFAKMGGLVIAQKGNTAADEIQRSRNALEVLGGVLVENRKVIIPGIDDDRYLIVIQKAKPTPADYPRHGGTITKKPL